ncbi:MAG: transposase family protein [bacterium]|nr:transposase family protein [bacterium]
MEYPYFREALSANHIHQADFVGPRYIKDDGRFYSFNIMDIFSHCVYIEHQRSKKDSQVAASLLRCWKTMGLPKIVQFDNELSFHGSNKYSRTPGLVIRLCLYYGIEPVFIPVKEPWRNGTIERFNDTYDKKFFRQQRFISYNHSKRESKRFQKYHNKNHRYSCLKGKTPETMLQSKPKTLGPNTKMPKLDYIPAGKIAVIRFIRSKCELDIFSEKFIVPKELVYSYVKAVIDTKEQVLSVYTGSEAVLFLKYKMTQ